MNENEDIKKGDTVTNRFAPGKWTVKQVSEFKLTVVNQSNNKETVGVARKDFRLKKEHPFF